MRVLLITFLALITLTTTSYAGPGATCSKVCRRVSGCKIFSYDVCMKMCGDQRVEEIPEKRAKALAQAKMSCPALADQLAPSQWLCTAEGASSYGHDMDGSAPDVWGTKDIYELGSGQTRAAAAYNAMRDCNATMTFQLDIDGERGAVISSQCHITRCTGPASAPKQRQQ